MLNRLPVIKTHGHTELVWPALIKY